MMTSAVALTLLLSFCGEAPSGGAPKAKDPHWSSTPPRIEGSVRFEKQVQAALTLIQERSPETYQLIQQNVAIIRQGRRSGMWAAQELPTYEMADPTTFYSVTWCAGSIAHDAMHAKLYRDYAARCGKPVPEEVWTGLESERQCIAFQLDVLKRIGASQHEVGHCAKLQGDHYDTNRDRKYDWDDYFRRNW